MSTVHHRVRRMFAADPTNSFTMLDKMDTETPSMKEANAAIRSGEALDIFVQSFGNKASRAATIKRAHVVGNEVWCCHDCLETSWFWMISYKRSVCLPFGLIAGKRVIMLRS